MRAFPRSEAFLESLCTPVSSSNALFSDQGPTHCAFPFLPWECPALPYPLKTQVKGGFWEAFHNIPECFPLLSLLALCTQHLSVTSCCLFICKFLSPPTARPTLAPEALVILGLPSQCLTEQVRDRVQWIRTWLLSQWHGLSADQL